MSSHAELSPDADVTPGAGPSSRAAVTAGLVRIAALVAAVTAASRVVGFVRTAVLGRVLGATYLGDTYTAANTIPNVVFEIVAGGALASLVIPVLAGTETETARRTASALLTWSVLLLTPVAVLGVLLRHQLAQALLGGAPEAQEQVAVGARMLAVFAPQVVFYGIGVVCTGILQSTRRFFAAALAPLVSSVVVIGAYLLFASTESSREIGQVGRGGELILSVGTTLGVVALCATVALPVLVLRPYGRLRPSTKFPPGVAIRVRRLAIAGLAAVGGQQVATAVALRLASGEQGAVVVFTLGMTAFLLPWGVLAVPVATSAFPELSTRAAAGDRPGYARTSGAGLRLVLLCGCAGAGLLVAVAAPLAQVLLAAAPGAGTSELRRAVIAFAPGLPGFAVLAFGTRALNALGHSRAAALATTVGWGAVVVADVVLVTVAPTGWRAAALGGGNAIGMTIAGVLLLVFLERTAGRSALVGAGRGFGVGLVVGGAAAAAGLGLTALLGSGAVALVVTTAAAGLVACGVWAVLDRAALMQLLKRRGAPR